MNYHFIQSKLNGNVIDIQKASTGPVGLLDAYPPKSAESLLDQSNQLWEFVPDPAGSGYYMIKSFLRPHVIGIRGNQPGARLDEALPVGGGTYHQSQLWQFCGDPAGSGYCFIMSKLNGNVIDIERASTKPGAPLCAYPLKRAGNANQLWRVVGGTFPSILALVIPGQRGSH